MCMVGGTSGRFVPKKPTVATEFPEILNQWNDDSDPSQITIGSGREVNWKCGKGHEWSKPLNYPMLTNIQKTHHLPWYFYSLPTIELSSHCLSLDRHFQTLSKRILAIFDKREFGEREWATLCIEKKRSELNSFGCDSLE